MTFAAESGGAGSQVLDIDFARRRGHDGVLPSEPRIQPGVGQPDAAGMRDVYVKCADSW